MALFLSTVFLSQPAFDLLRPGEGKAGKQFQLTQPPVEARLWEDPIAALIRHQAKLKELCSDVAANGTSRVHDALCSRSEQDAAGLRKQLDQGAGDLTVIAALLPGASFIGVEEARRRMRYAVLLGLDAEGFVPKDSEHMGLLRVRPCHDFTGCGANTVMGNLQRLLTQAAPLPAKIDIPYETLTTERGTIRNAVILWISDTAVGPQWLSTLTVLLGDVAPPHKNVRLRILGPYGSNELVSALGEDLEARTIEAAGIDTATALKAYLRNWQTLSRLRLISPYSTASAEQLRQVAERSGKSHLLDCPTQKDCVDETFKQRFGRIAGILSQHEPVTPMLGWTTPDPFFVRTIGTDDKLIELLVRELCARGLGDGGRVALLGEWNSVYARSFGDLLQEKLHCATTGHKVTPEFYPYLRGLDGANLDGAAKQVRLVPRAGDNRAGDKNDSKDAGIEWPESRDQRDYLRRLVQKLQKGANPDDAKTLIRAIGIIGSDVHDKLVLVQALRAGFPDRVLFTTDLDVRLLHPEVAQYTRNLVVASSLPLAFDQEHGNRAAPFRDVYQTAVFLGTRYASSSDEGLQLRHIADRLGEQRLFEIGRGGEVALSIDKVSGDELSRRHFYSGLSFAILLGLGWLMLYGWPAPAMKAVRTNNAASLALLGRRSTALITGLEAAVWGYGLGVVIELWSPGVIGLDRTWLIAGTFLLSFWAFCYPGMGSLRAGLRSAVGRKPIGTFWRRLRWLVVVGLLAWVVWGLFQAPETSRLRYARALCAVERR